MNDQTIKSENKFLGYILIISITIVTGILFIPELHSSFDNTFHNINDKSDPDIILAEVKISDTDYLLDE